MFPSISKVGKYSGAQSKCANRVKVRSYHSSSADLMWPIHPNSIQGARDYVPKSKSNLTPMKEKRKELDEIREKHRQNNKIAETSGWPNPWTLKCATIVERPQVITPPPESWLETYEKFMEKWYRPILSQYPAFSLLDEDIESLKQKQTEAARREKELKRIIETETAEEKAERLLKEEREKRMRALRDKMKDKSDFKTQSRLTEADRTNDVRSVYRKLDSKLFLIVKKNRPDNTWQFPQSALKQDEVLRAAAVRTLKEECNQLQGLQTFFVGHGPIYFHSYPYPSTLQSKLNTYGAKVFFMYSYYLDGNVSINNKHIVDYAWVTKEELKTYFSADLYRSLENSLPNDGVLETLRRDMPNYKLGQEEQGQEEREQQQDQQKQKKANK